jgi:hypothetical protein
MKISFHSVTQTLCDAVDIYLIKYVVTVHTFNNRTVSADHSGALSKMCTVLDRSYTQVVDLIPT